MKTKVQIIELKDGTVIIPEWETKYLANVLEIVNVKDFTEMTNSEFSNALIVEKMCSGETIMLAGNN